MGCFRYQITYEFTTLMTKKKAHKPGSATIALNKRARHEYFIEEEFEAGLALQGWEVKSLRAGKANIGDSYVILKDGGLAVWRKLYADGGRLDTCRMRPNPNPQTVVKSA